METNWRNEVCQDERGINLLNNVLEYAYGNPSGLPGHNLMVMIGKMAKILDEYETGKRGVVVERQENE